LTTLAAMVANLHHVLHHGRGGNPDLTVGWHWSWSCLTSLM